LYRIVQPERVSGSGFDYVALVNCAYALTQLDGSIAWNFVNLASHHWMLGMFDPLAQDAVWDRDANTLIASSFIFPAGRAKIRCATGIYSVGAGRSRRGSNPANGTCRPDAAVTNYGRVALDLPSENLTL
jgi:hypothetical protein